MTASHDPFASIDDASIDDAAMLVHEEYLARHADPSRSGYDRQGQPHPAMYPWQRLDSKLKKQNYDQVRANVVRLFELGYELRKVDEPAHRERAEADLSLVVEALGREEHDRWCRLKRQQGYVYGRTRQDDSSVGPRQHPDLRDWDDLDEETREKDLAPIRSMIDVFRACGYFVASRR